MPVQDPSERPLIPADVFPLRRAEEATTLAKRTELSNDGRQSSTAVRRADGLATSAALGTLLSNHNQFSARANPKRDAAMLEQPNSKQLPPSSQLNAPIPPCCKAETPAKLQPPPGPRRKCPKDISLPPLAGEMPSGKGGRCRMIKPTTPRTSSFAKVSFRGRLLRKQGRGACQPNRTY